MYCTGCGQLVDSDAEFCTSCGQATKRTAPAAQSTGALQPPTPLQYPVQAQRTSGFAIASLVLGIVWIYWIGSVLAVIFGHVSLNQMKRDPSLGGRGLAIAGLVLGYLGLAALAAVVALVFLIGASLYTY